MATRFAEARATAQEALQFHAQGKPGKLEITPTKPLNNQRDLSLAYSPGVADALPRIGRSRRRLQVHGRGNLVAVVTNGTAVLGLGNIGALAGKPVMEGKADLFKQFADIDVFDLEVGAEDPTTFIEVVAAARAHVRRHQSRRHQGARLLLHRGDAAKSA